MIVVFVFGNSHVATFCASPPCSKRSPRIEIGKGITNPDNPSITSVYLGRGIIAYNFQTKHLPKVFASLKQYGASPSDIALLYVGEVDCRYHLAKRVLAGGDRAELVRECVERFFEAVLDLKRSGQAVAVAGTHPTTTEGHDEHPDHPHWGDCALRNGVCAEWNKQLAALCDAEDIPFVSIYDRLVDENNITKMEYFVDYCHLSYDKCFPMLLEEMRRVGVVRA